MRFSTHMRLVQAIIMEMIDRDGQVVSRVQQAGVCVGSGGDCPSGSAVLVLQRSIACCYALKLTDGEFGPETIGTGCKSQRPAEDGLDIGLAHHLGKLKDRQTDRQIGRRTHPTRTYRKYPKVERRTRY